MVFEGTSCDETLVASWVPNPAVPQVPAPVLDAVVAVPLEEGHAGTVVGSGAAEATVMGSDEQADADVEAARQARCVYAFCIVLTGID